MAVTAPRDALCLVFRRSTLGGQSFHDVLSSNGTWAAARDFRRSGSARSGV